MKAHVDKMEVNPIVEGSDLTTNTLYEIVESSEGTYEGSTVFITPGKELIALAPKVIHWGAVPSSFKLRALASGDSITLEQE